VGLKEYIFILYFYRLQPPAYTRKTLYNVRVSRHASPVLSNVHKNTSRMRRVVVRGDLLYLLGLLKRRRRVCAGSRAHGLVSAARAPHQEAGTHVIS
jgi:hypothetical protein